MRLFRNQVFSVGNGFAFLAGIALAEQLARAGIRPGAAGPGVEADNVQAIQRLTEPVRSVVLGAFSNALDDVFLVGVPFVALAVVVALLLKEEPPRTGQP
jgi:hypothetical protein